MRLNRLAFLAACLPLVVGSCIFAGPVVVLPPQGGIAAQVFTDTLSPIGNVQLPLGAFRALVTPQGERIIFLSSNTSSAVTLVSFSGGSLGSPTSINLGGQRAWTGAVSPDGSTLVVGTGTANVADTGGGSIYVIDLSTGQVQSGATKDLSGLGRPKAVAFTADSRYLLVLTETGGLVSIDYGASGFPFTNVASGISSPDALSISPAGRIFVSTMGAVQEYNAVPPFAFKGSIAFEFAGERCDKFNFSLDGRYAIARSLSAALTGRSLYLFDLSATSPVGLIKLAAYVSIPKATNGSSAVDDLVATGNRSWTVLSTESAGKIYTASASASGGLDLAQISYSGVTSSGVTGMVASGEMPIPRSLFFSSGQLLQRVEMSSSTAAGSQQVASDEVNSLVTSSIGAPASIYRYGDGLILPLNPSPTPIVYGIKLLDANGLPVFNAQVNFSASSGVYLSSSSARTNSAGIAQISVTPPVVNGDFTVQAVAAGLSVTLTSTVSSQATGTGNIRFIRVSGDGQLIMVTTTSTSPTSPLVARLVDSEGKPIAGKTVTVTSTGAAIAIVPITGLTTDSNGEVRIPWFVNDLIDAGGAGYIATNVALASDGVPTTVFKGVAVYARGLTPNLVPKIEFRVPVPPAVTVTARAGVPTDGAFDILVTLANTTVPLPNVGLSVQAPDGAAITANCGDEIPLTDATGVARCSLLVKGPVSNQVFPLIVSVGGAYKVYNDFNVMLQPGVGVPKVTAGDGQSANLGAVLPLLLQAQVLDLYGNAPTGTAVTWSVIPPGAGTLLNQTTTVPSSGYVTTQVRVGNTPGTYQVRLTVDGGSSVTFSFTANSAGSLVRVVSGNNQSAALNAAFPAPLVVEVLDDRGVAVPNVPVSFGVVNGRATVPATATTGSDGRAQVSVTAGDLAGAVVIDATVAGVVPATFTLTVLPPGPAVGVAGFVNGGSGDPGITPGGLALINGTGLVQGVNGQMNASLLNGNLPYELAGFNVEFQTPTGTGFAPVYAVSNINGQQAALVQVPFEIGGSVATAVVSGIGGVKTTVTGIPVKALQPGMIRNTVEGREQAVIIRSDGSVVSPSNPAIPGEHVRAYVTGLGQTQPAASTNHVGIPGQRAVGNVIIGINNGGYQPVSVYLAQNLIGIFEVEFVIPSDVPSGANIPFTIAITPVGATEPVFDSRGSVIAIGR